MNFLADVFPSVHAMRYTVLKPPYISSSYCGNKLYECKKVKNTSGHEFKIYVARIVLFTLWNGIFLVSIFIFNRVHECKLYGCKDMEMCKVGVVLFKIHLKIFQCISLQVKTFIDPTD